MEIEVRVPSVGESVTEALLAEWFKADGSRVKKDEALFLLETDKVTLEVQAEADGVLHVLVAQGTTVTVGQLVGKIEAQAAGSAEASPPPPPKKEKEKEKEKPAPAPAASPAPAAAGVYPSVEGLLKAGGVDASALQGTGPEGRLTANDVLLHLESQGAAVPPAQPGAPSPAAPAAPAPSRPVPVGTEDEPIVRKPLSPIRRRIGERLMHAVQSTAMLTTFNEVDMGKVMALRTKYKDAFRERHGTSLGITSFFVKAVVEALQAFPEINASIVGDDVVYHDYWHIGVAVGSERGLVVPVVRHADRLGLPGIERAIADFSRKVKENRLELSDLEGGTFTITNGGVFGSLLSTPILNPPQSAILGLHKVEDRPMAIGGQVVIRPMMYVALTYDHRMVDGRDAVRFLVRVKEEIEEPDRLLVEV